MVRIWQSEGSNNEESALSSGNTQIGETMTATIRAAKLSDADTIARFNAAMALETEGKRLNDATIRAGVRAVIDDPGKGFYLVAERNGQQIGQLMITFEFSDWRNGNYWWIQSVYVPPEFRKLGIFRQLFERVRTMATADPGVIGLRLYAELENEKAQRVYESLGMSAEPYRMFGLYPLPGRDSAY